MAEFINIFARRSSVSLFIPPLKLQNQATIFSWFLMFSYSPHPLRISIGGREWDEYEGGGEKEGRRHNRRLVCGGAFLSQATYSILSSAIPFYHRCLVLMDSEGGRDLIEAGEVVLGPRFRLYSVSQPREHSLSLPPSLSLLLWSTLMVDLWYYD